MTTTDSAVLVLRLAAPLQSWGAPSRYNRRDTRPQPTKSGVLGLLAAAAGRPRGASLTDLLGLRLGIRVDQPGSLLRDYHTVSDHRGLPLPASKVDAKGTQKRTSPAKHTHITQRYYLQDAVFIAALRGPTTLLEELDHAVKHPYFPLALGRRSCPPTGPLSLGLHPDTELSNILSTVPWQASHHHRRRNSNNTHVSLEATIEDPQGEDLVADVPDIYHLRKGTTYSQRAVKHLWITVPTSLDASTADTPSQSSNQGPQGHDPFALLGW
ncbi:type I-E CRISPR-associated protein Cas5/CasD [Streptomyces sp. NPDC088354]|uniref:type I-E CRISPR-associated protein Cas5/CasD n=1 Tax=Streptomyces sp. NPDC088354 TaxID=3365856 RepID=UPI0038065289